MTVIASPAPPQILREWMIARDSDDAGRSAGWATAVASGAKKAVVPGCIQQIFPDQHGLFWYWCRFRAVTAPRGGDRALITFAAVDYKAECWLNGKPIGGHEGGETPFTLDVTGVLDAQGDNLLAMRVLNPIEQAIDGIKLAETPHRNKFVTFQPGNSYNYGGIIAPVELTVVPAVRIGDLWLRPSMDGRIAVTATLVNHGDAAADAEIVLTAAPGVGGDAVATARSSVRVAPGAHEHELSLSIASPRLWDVEEPNLYRVVAQLTGRGIAHERAARCGFRDFRVVDGYFQLNGRRLWLRSTHTGNQMPVGQVVPQEPDLMRRDLIMAKASGYNCVRYISGMPYPPQLDFCDELGLMVYEENLSAWLLADTPKMAERFDASLVEMVRRDRNHPCIAIWGLLNETHGGAVAKHAAASLPLLRRHDPTRLTLLSSGRWDGYRSIGSVCNPGETTWRHEWGSEAPGAADYVWKMGWEPAGGYVPEAGDAHTYPLMPFDDRTNALMRGLGGDKPVFLSEFGVGSQINAIEEAKGFGRYDDCDAAPDRAFLTGLAQRFVDDWTRWGFESVFPFPEDFLRASSLHMGRQRRTSFDLVRSNPRLCGYNLTGMLDHAHTGEGLWTLWRRWKPGAIEVLQDGWAPLRWCLFAPRHVYAGEAFAIEAVLADDAALPAGQLPARVRVFAQGRGAVWERRATITVPAGRRDARPLTWAVLNERVENGLPAGRYEIAANLESGGIAGADRLLVRVSDRPAALSSRRIAVLGVAPEALSWLQKHGVVGVPFTADGSEDIVLVGNPPPEIATDVLWSAVRARAERGATVVFGSAEALVAAEGKPRPLGEDVAAHPFHDWLYHHDGAIKPHAIFAGLETGLLDWDAYGPVTPKHLLTRTFAADDVVAAGFAVGYSCAGGYVSGPTVAIRASGRGRLILSTLRVLENLGKHPVADALLVNLIGFAGRP